MACYPDYNLNSPYTPNSTLAETYDSLSNEEKSESLYKMWSNKSVAETYEPGSVFKVITASVALEENITTTDKSNDFYCKGYEEFEDSSASQPLKISCWRANPHGVQSLRQALCNSCNPAFMQLGKELVLQLYINIMKLSDYLIQQILDYMVNKVVFSKSWTKLDLLN